MARYLAAKCPKCGVYTAPPVEAKSPGKPTGFKMHLKCSDCGEKFWVPADELEVIEEGKQN